MPQGSLRPTRSGTLDSRGDRHSWPLGQRRSNGGGAHGIVLERRRALLPERGSVRRDDNGDNWLVERRDTHVKSHGSRIELADVESAIHAKRALLERAALPDQLPGSDWSRSPRSAPARLAGTSLGQAPSEFRRTVPERFEVTRLAAELATADGSRSSSLRVRSWLSRLVSLGELRRPRDTDDVNTGDQAVARRRAAGGAGTTARDHRGATIQGGWGGDRPSGGPTFMREPLRFQRRGGGREGPAPVRDESSDDRAGAAWARGPKAIQTPWARPSLHGPRRCAGIAGSTFPGGEAGDWTGINTGARGVVRALALRAELARSTRHAYGARSLGRGSPGREACAARALDRSRPARERDTGIRAGKIGGRPVWSARKVRLFALTSRTDHPASRSTRRAVGSGVAHHSTVSSLEGSHSSSKGLQPSSDGSNACSSVR
jgi:hypothetical protein